MSRIHEVATINSKGQITLPKPIRQALGVDAGGKVAFDFNGKVIMVTRAEPGEHTDPAIAQFLAMLERDLAEGKNVTALPAALAKSLQQAKKRRIKISDKVIANSPQDAFENAGHSGLSVGTVARNGPFPGQTKRRA